jgi:hypothetical protein
MPVGYIDDFVRVAEDVPMPDIVPRIVDAPIVPARLEVLPVTVEDGIIEVNRWQAQQGASIEEIRRYNESVGVDVPVNPRARELYNEYADVRDNPEVADFIRRQDAAEDALAADRAAQRLAQNADAARMPNLGGVLDAVGTAYSGYNILTGQGNILDYLDIATAAGAAAGVPLAGPAGAVIGAASTGIEIGDFIRRQLGNQFPETFLYPDERIDRRRRENLEDPDIDIPEGSRDYDPERDWRCPVNYAGSITVTWEDSLTGPGSTTDSFGNAPGPLRLEVEDVQKVQGISKRYSVKYSENAVAVSRTTPPEAIGVQFYQNIRRLDNGYDNCGRLVPIGGIIANRLRDAYDDFFDRFPEFADDPDGLPNPAPEPVGGNPFDDWEFPTFPPFDLPQPDINPDRNPINDPEPVGGTPPSPFPPYSGPGFTDDPTGGYDPSREPAGGPIGEPDDGDDNPPINPDRDVLNPECCSVDANQRILELLRGIESALKVEALTIDVTPCEAEDDITINSQDALGSNFEALAQGIEKLHDLVKCPPQVDTVLPEIFLSKSPRIKPQCKITYTNEGSSWALTIPQFNEALKDVISLSPYQKGNVMCVLDLLDNSSITLNAISEGEGIRVIGELVQYVLPQFVPSDWMSRIKVTKYNRNLSTKLVTPKQAKYWSEGDMRSVADWIRKLT